MKICDEAFDFPELWRNFNVHYVAAANFPGLFFLFYQQLGPTFVQKNLLAEFVRLNEDRKRIIQLKEQPHSNLLITPKKALFQSPFTRCAQDLSTTAEKEGTSSESSEGGGASVTEAPSKQMDSDKLQLLEGNDEWR